MAQEASELIRRPPGIWRMALRTALWALAVTPPVWFVATMVLIVSAEAERRVVELQQGPTWIAVVVQAIAAFVIAVPCVYWFERRRGSQEHRATHEAMVVYWKWQRLAQGIGEPTEDELEYARECLGTSLTEWASYALKIRPGTQYPRHPFELTDRLMASYDALLSMWRTGTPSIGDLLDGI